jgi:hypothetical protein
VDTLNAIHPGRSGPDHGLRPLERLEHLAA